MNIYLKKADLLHNSMYCKDDWEIFISAVGRDEYFRRITSFSAN